VIDVEGLDGVLHLGGASPARSRRSIDPDGIDGLLRAVASGRAIDPEGIDGVLYGAAIRAIPALVEVWATEQVAAAVAPPRRFEDDASTQERAATIGLTVVRTDRAEPGEVESPAALEADEHPEHVGMVEMVGMVELSPTELIDLPPEVLVPVTELLEAELLEVEPLDLLETELLTALEPDPPASAIDVRPDEVGAGEPPEEPVPVRVEAAPAPPPPAPRPRPMPTLEPPLPPREPVAHPTPAAPGRADRPPLPAPPEAKREPAPRSVVAHPTPAAPGRADRPPPPAPPPWRGGTALSLPPPRRPAHVRTPLPLAVRPHHSSPPVVRPAVPPPASALSSGVPTPAVSSGPWRHDVPPHAPPQLDLTSLSLLCAAVLLALSFVVSAAVLGAGVGFALSRQPPQDPTPGVSPTGVPAPGSELHDHHKP
jgi:hypothetical protein